MNRFSTIENINRKYRNSRAGARDSTIGGYPSTYSPPPVSLALGGNVGGTVVRQGGFRNSYVAGTTLPAGLPQGAQVIRIEEPAQVIYHQATPISPRISVPTAVPVPPPQLAKAITTPAVAPPIDVPVMSHPVHPSQTPIRKSRIGAQNDACPWWCWLLFGVLGLLLLLGLLVGVWVYLSQQKGRDSNQVKPGEQPNDQNKGQTGQDSQIPPVGSGSEEREKQPNQGQGQGDVPPTSSSPESSGNNTST